MVAYYLEGEAVISEAAVVASVAIPVAVFSLTLTFLHSVMVEADRLYYWMGALLLVLLAGAIALAAAGAPVALCLVMIAIAPVATVIADENVGHQHRKAAMQRLEATQD